MFTAAEREELRAGLIAACLRHGVSAYQGRGMDDLPPEVTAPLPGLLRELARNNGATDVGAGTLTV